MTSSPSAPSTPSPRRLAPWLTAVLLGALGAGCVEAPTSDNDHDSSGGKADGADDYIDVAGKRIPRLSPFRGASPFTLAESFVSTFTLGAPINHRYQSVDEQVVLAQPTRLGALAVVRPGVGNVAPSAAWLTVLAQHFDTVVVMYANLDSVIEDVGLRKLDSLSGVSFPERLTARTNIWAIGSDAAHLISFPLQSDHTLEQLDQLWKLQDQLGVDPLAGDTWVFAHSQGVNDMVITDARLREAGFPGFGPIVGVCGAVLGGRFTANPAAWAIIPVAAGVGGFQGVDAMVALQPVQSYNWMEQVLRPTDTSIAGIEAAIGERIDLAVAGAINPFWPGFVRPLMYNLSLYPNELGWVLPNDGFVDAHPAELGRHTVTLSGDHFSMIEDPSIAQEIAQQLVNGDFTDPPPVN
ncbi:MAG: hypothetical protein AB7O24_06075 [Kofleriaceae bacterium]